MIIFINVDKIIFINTTVIGRRICYMASFPTNELNNLFITHNTKVVNRWDGGETAKGSSRKLSLGLDLRFDLGWASGRTTGWASGRTSGWTSGRTSGRTSCWASIWTSGRASLLI
jgi:hypothetical protein